MATGDDEERNSKATHLERLSDELGVPMEQMLLYDDSKAAVESVRRRDCGALLLSGTSGLRVVDLVRGLDMYLAAMRSRREAGLDASGFTAREREEPDYERRRKMQQERRGREGDRQAEADVAPAEEQLKNLPSEPAFWLAAPLRASGGGGGAIDWALVDEAGGAFETCAWPRLSSMQTPEWSPDDEEGARCSLGRCVLAHVRPGEAVSHAYLLENVEVSCSDGRVSGDLRRRGLNAGGDAATRMLQADGSHRTMHTGRVTGHPLSNVELLPLLTAQLPALRLLRRLVLRLEHLSLLVEMAQQPSGPLASSWLPLGCVPVPLDRLVSALTSKGASAEAVATSATPNEFLHDPRGCCHYEVAEWAGDADLDLIAKAFIMTQKTVESENKLNPAAESILRNLNLRQRALTLELPTAGLFAPFVAARWLPDMRRSPVSKKEQADLVEALLGVICEAQRGGADVAGTPRELTRMFAASLAFFQSHVHPSVATATVVEDAMTFLWQTMRGTNDLRREALEQRHGSRVLEVAAPLRVGEGGFLRRRDLLLECCVLSKETPFQRLEFLGDAFLQFADSMELRKRYPGKTHGELTSIRSALVRNVHLGRLLTRRYGVAATLAFFAEMEGERERAVHAFVVEEVGDRWSVAEVLEQQLGEAAQAEAGLQGGGCGAGATDGKRRTSKKLAKKVAYYLAYRNERLHWAVREEAALHATAVPPPPPPPPPPSPAAATYPPGEDPIGVLTRRVTIAGLDVQTFLRWDYEEHIEGSTRLYECALTISFDGTRLGVARAASKKMAKAAAAQPALEYIDSAAPSLLSPSQRSRPSAQDACGDSTNGLTDSHRYILEKILLERNVGYQIKVAKLMVRCGQPDEELVALAQRAHMLSSQGGPSAGRRFHDEIKAMCEAAERGDLFPDERRYGAGS